MQQNVNLNLILDQVAKDKGIDRPKLIEILEEAIGSAAKRHFGMERSLKARYDEDKGQVDLFQVLTIVDDPSEEVPIPDPVNMVPVSLAHEKGIEVEPGDELEAVADEHRVEDPARLLGDGLLADASHRAAGLPKNKKVGDRRPLS